MAANPNTNRRPINEEDDLVRVFDTSDEAEAMVVQGLLESNGIESLLTNLDAPQDVLPGVGGVVLRVRAIDADLAREIIEQQRNEESGLEEPSGTDIG